MATILSDAGTGAMLNGNGLFYQKISPAFVGSARLTNLSCTYQWYAFRKIRFTYVPLIGATTAGAIAFGTLHSIGPVLSAGAFNTTGEVLQTGPGAIMTPLWQKASFEFDFHGTKLWPTTTNATTDAFEQIQGALVCCGQNMSGATTYGVLQVDYVLDLYWPTQIVTNITEKKEDPRIYPPRSMMAAQVASKSDAPDGGPEIPAELAKLPLIREDYSASQGPATGGGLVIVRSPGHQPQLSPAPTQASAAFRR
jgi:hypothetical protein